MLKGVVGAGERSETPPSHMHTCFSNAAKIVLTRSAHAHTQEDTRTRETLRAQSPTRFARTGSVTFALLMRHPPRACRECSIGIGQCGGYGALCGARTPSPPRVRARLQSHALRTEVRDARDACAWQRRERSEASNLMLKPRG